jgi:3-mercaptopyruvate sulfurtransferase SseA
LRSRTDNTDLVFVDTRSREAFAEGHLEGAEWFPEEQWLSGRELWPERSLLVVVAETEESGRNQGHLFASWGYRAVLVLRGGFRAWQTAFGDRFVATGDPGPPVDE